MASVALATLFLALAPFPARADSCGDAYFSCRVACESDPNCSSYYDCYCAYLSCEGQTLPPSCNVQ
jgi:hypothetical protein